MRFQEELMDWLAKVFNFLFGCHHRNVSRVFSIGGETYKVCWDCGAKFNYSLEKMSIEHHTYAPGLPTLGHARIVRGVR
jgi:hypothetical protein